MIREIIKHPLQPRHFLLASGTKACFLGRNIVGGTYDNDSWLEFSTRNIFAVYNVASPRHERPRFAFNYQ